MLGRENRRRVIARVKFMPFFGVVMFNKEEIAVKGWKCLAMVVVEVGGGVE